MVSPHLAQRTSQRAGRVSAQAAAAAAPSAGDVPLPFQLGIPALDAFPRKPWSRLAARRMRAMSVADMFYGDPSGYGPLREAIAAYLLVSRGVACLPAQVFVTAGYRASLALISQALLRRGDTVWIEDPGFPPTREVLRSAAHRIVPVPVDEEGIVVDQGCAGR